MLAGPCQQVEADDLQVKGRRTVLYCVVLLQSCTTVAEPWEGALAALAALVAAGAEGVGTTSQRWGCLPAKCSACIQARRQEWGT